MATLLPIVIYLGGRGRRVAIDNIQIQTVLAGGIVVMPVCKSCLAEKVMTDFKIYRVVENIPSYRRICLDCYNKNCRENDRKRMSDPDYRKRINARQRIRRARPEIRAVLQKRERARRNRPEVREARRKKVALPNALRRMRLRGLEATLTIEQWQEILELYGYRCVYCHKKKKLTKDRLDSLRGYTADNVVPACASCNSKKRDGRVLCPVQGGLLFTGEWEGKTASASFIKHKRPALLTPSIAKHIVQLYREGLPSRQLMEMFGVSRSVISGVVSGSTYSWATGIHRGEGIRVACGERKPNSRVTRHDVISIRQRYAAGESQPVLAAEFQVNPSTISNIITRKTWKHVPSPSLPSNGLRIHGPHGESHGLTRLTNTQVQEIYRRASAGEAYRRIAQEFPASATTVANIHHGVVWAHVTSHLAASGSLPVYSDPTISG